MDQINFVNHEVLQVPPAITRSAKELTNSNAASQHPISPGVELNTHLFQSTDGQLSPTNEVKSFSFSLENTLQSRYVASGFVIGEGPVDQSSVSISSHGFSAKIWQDFSFQENAVNERDFIGAYSQSIGTLAGAAVSARLGYAYWDFPSETLGTPVHALHGGLHFEGTIDLDLDFKQIIPDQAHEEGTLFTLDAHKALKLGSTESPWSLRASVNMTGARHFFTKDSGLTSITPGLGLLYSESNYDLEIFVKEQIGLSGRESQPFFGLRFGYKF